MEREYTRTRTIEMEYFTKSSPFFTKQNYLPNKLDKLKTQEKVIFKIPIDKIYKYKLEEQEFDFEAFLLSLHKPRIIKQKIYKNIKLTKKKILNRLKTNNIIEAQGNLINGNSVKNISSQMKIPYSKVYYLKSKMEIESKINKIRKQGKERKLTDEDAKVLTGVVNNNRDLAGVN